MPPRASIPKLGDALPASGGPLTRALGRWGLARLGWRIDGALPNIPQAVVIVAPHTSNWDFVIGIAAKFALGLRAAWLGKHTLFRPPFGGLMRWLGGIPVDRTKPQDMVAQSVSRFAEQERLLLAVSPEGTRKAVPRWKSGFYHIARGAGVPIIPVAFDWTRHALAIGPAFTTTGDIDADLDALAAFFASARGRRGELTPPPR